MTPAEELREAARQMRSKASGVYPERPWNELVVGRSGTALIHALSWTPAVAVAVADWLDNYAERFKDWRGPHVSAELSCALNVARAYLDGPR